MSGCTEAAARARQIVRRCSDRPTASNGLPTKVTAGNSADRLRRTACQTFTDIFERRPQFEAITINSLDRFEAESNVAPTAVAAAAGVGLPWGVRVRSEPDSQSTDGLPRGIAGRS